MNLGIFQVVQRIDFNGQKEKGAGGEGEGEEKEEEEEEEEEEEKEEEKEVLCQLSQTYVYCRLLLRACHEL